jgi:hypothetical protein
MLSAASKLVLTTHPLPWEWIDLGEIIDANGECVLEFVQEEALGELIVDAVNALAKARAA